MNVLTFPNVKTPLKKGGELREEYFSFFSMNNQELQAYFSNDGHLVPTRTDSDLKILSTTQYIGRFAYNGTTNNHMANTAGVFQNLTMNVLSTQAAIVSMTPSPNRIEQYGDENSNLYANVNGTLNGITATDKNLPIKFNSFDGTNLTLTINGVPRKIATTP